MSYESYRDFDVWKQGIGLVVNIYEITKHFPEDERFCLMQQIRRAAISIPSNIAEGWGCGPTREFIHFLRIA